ncbi:MAG: BamA/TamA family outer membrane protein [Crocinitomicaceae bacterium]|nr:BamA/TamA family outer membrane protein [Crocinitomicaceae bacterium]
MKLKHTYILLIFVFLAAACRQTKYVPKGKYLLKKNIVLTSGDDLDKDELEEILRQQPNYRSLGIKWKLLAYNMIDSGRVANKRHRKNIKLHLKNNKRRQREKEINKRRIMKARAKNDTVYTEKIIPLKDTVNPKMFFREWYKYKIGKPPVVFDSIPFEKSVEQLNAFLRKRGYYYGNVTSLIKYKQNKKAVVTYYVEPGPKYMVDSVYVICDNPGVLSRYSRFLQSLEKTPFLNEAFDSDDLDDFRDDVSKYMRDEALFGFSSNHIRYLADTNRTKMTVTLGIRFQDRLLKSELHRDSLIKVKHATTRIRNVYFHISDTSMFEGSFKDKMKSLGLDEFDGQFVNTMNTYRYQEIKKRKSNELEPERMATFKFNGALFVKPSVIETQNYLEETRYYQEKYVEQSYTRLLQLGLFKAIKTELIEIREDHVVDVHHYLVPAKRQSFSLEPKATNSNGFIGVSASVNYTNRNLFRGGEKLTLAFSGGFESQPPVFDETVDGQSIQTAGRSFNTFEFGPSLGLEIPGLFPVKSTLFSKRHLPKTEMSVAYNFQRRDAFTRGTFQLNYLWKFTVERTQEFTLGLPGASVLKFVSITKKDEFQNTLDNLNDLFLQNAYSRQFIWQDLKLGFVYNSRNKERRNTRSGKKQSQLYFSSTLDVAGNILSAFKKYQDTLNGQSTFLGVGYSQFSRIDNELIVSKPFKEGRSVHLKISAGGGLPYGNSSTSLPYDYSFFAGGANDNRGWRARALGPGTYKYYLDTNRAGTQIGDIRVGGSAEYRFSFNSFFQGAFFLDAGNIWTINNDENRVGGQISKNWYKEIALATGVGLRMDFDYFIVRIDLGFPIRNPALPDGAKWLFSPRENYYAEGMAVFGPGYVTILPAPFSPHLHFGIGYPF